MPQRVSVLGIVGGDEAGGAVFASSDTGYHHSLDDQGCAGAAVALAEVRHDFVPERLPRVAVERDEVRIEGGHEDGVAEHGNSAIGRRTAQGDGPIQ